MGSVDEPVANTAQPTRSELRPAVPRPEAAAPAAGPPATGQAPGTAAGRRPKRARRRRWRSAVRTAVSFPRRPSGRLTLSGALISVLVVASAASGAYLVPRVSAAPGEPPGAAATSGVPPTAEVAPPSEPGLATPSVPASLSTTGRPADQLAAWAAPLAARLSIPPVVMEAYAYAEIVELQQAPACQLRWTTLAGIGKVESNHGQAAATLGPDGKALPSIIGPALDGQDGRQRIADTDAGALDQDDTWDHAVGPMQFIPATWKQFAVDADRDGTTDPNDIDDATLAAAAYLCSGGRDLSTAGGWWAAVLAYNDVQAYAKDVFDAANDYGVRSR